jgi:hypothetical protein
LREHAHVDVVHFHLALPARTATAATLSEIPCGCARVL